MEIDLWIFERLRNPSGHFWIFMQQEFLDYLYPRIGVVRTERFNRLMWRVCDHLNDLSNSGTDLSDDTDIISAIGKYINKSHDTTDRAIMVECALQYEKWENRMNDATEHEITYSLDEEGNVNYVKIGHVVYKDKDSTLLTKILLMYLENKKHKENGIFDLEME